MLMKDMNNGELFFQLYFKLPNGSFFNKLIKYC